jgi:hypothetical protein
LPAGARRAAPDLEIVFGGSDRPVKDPALLPEEEVIEDA